MTTQPTPYYAILESFPFEDIRSRFYYESKEVNGWGSSEVKVYDRHHSTSDSIYEYKRNYSMLKTFEPFRVWDAEDRSWRNLALISPNYTSFEVLDLDNKGILAKKTISKEQLENLGPREHSFCPASFHVPDPLDILDERDTEEFKNAPNGSEETKTFWVEWMEHFVAKRTFGFEAGCIWGDDWSYKIQAVDLSNVLQGVVHDDDRFGYIVLQGDLKDCYDKNYYDEDNGQYFALNVPVSFKFSKDDPKTVERTWVNSIIPSFSLKHPAL